jgi:hypothetical protein
MVQQLYNKYTYDMSFSVAEQQTRDTTATNSPCPNKILRIASLHTVLTFEVNYEKETRDAQHAGVSAKHVYPSIRDHTSRTRVHLPPMLLVFPLT